MALAFDYFDAVTESDISRVDGVKRVPEKVRRFMRSYARHQGTQTSVDVIKQDMLSNEDNTISENSIINYIDALKMIFEYIQETERERPLPPWALVPPTS